MRFAGRKNKWKNDGGHDTSGKSTGKSTDEVESIYFQLTTRRRTPKRISLILVRESERGRHAFAARCSGIQRTYGCARIDRGCIARSFAVSQFSLRVYTVNAVARRRRAFVYRRERQPSWKGALGTSRATPDTPREALLLRDLWKCVTFQR